MMRSADDRARGVEGSWDEPTPTYNVTGEDGQPVPRLDFYGDNPSAAQDAGYFPEGSTPGSGMPGLGGGDGLLGGGGRWAINPDTGEKDWIPMDDEAFNVWYGTADNPVFGNW